MTRKWKTVASYCRDDSDGRKLYLPLLRSDDGKEVWTDGTLCEKRYAELHAIALGAAYCQGWEDAYDEIMKSKKEPPLIRTL